ncbi:hypothetical protein BL253_32300 [Pseudofrankia asymbiotica]|uniref:FAD-binding PCMH-type domain-containing protein n=1 Tax=Pseudofrankia asymbiotica TaxID=1834516 RepID=A0A1V2I231_9ACTN|nr:hypothetical protein BL253_32300 [Pseudofrankia asymbiotica]
MIDWTKYCDRLLSVDPEARTCVVEPGIVLDVLNRQLSGYELRFGPEPATHPNCTLGGMIGNNSCGATAQRTGKVVDNIARLEVLLYDGTRFWCGETDDEQYARIERHGDRRAAVYRSLRRLRDQYAGEIRARYPDIPRERTLVVLGFETVARAVDAVPAVLAQHYRGLVVGLEPSCATVLRADAAELMPEDLDIARLAKQSVTLAELLTRHTPGWSPPRLPTCARSRRCTATSTPCSAGRPTRNCSTPLAPAPSHSLPAVADWRATSGDRMAPRAWIGPVLGQVSGPRAG